MIFLKIGKLNSYHINLAFKYFVVPLHVFPAGTFVKLANLQEELRMRFFKKQPCFLNFLETIKE